MPDFYLGLTSATAPTSTNGESQPAITIPDGVSTLDFGGVDTTAFFGTNPANSLNGNGQNNQFTVSLGIPQYAGTRIIMNKIITNSVPATGQRARPRSRTASPSRLWAGSASSRPTRSTAARRTSLRRSRPAGGVVVEALPETAAAITGEIGFLRVGGNATSFSVSPTTTSTPSSSAARRTTCRSWPLGGTRNLYFGKGMDTTTIQTHTIQNLFANRGAINSKVIADRQIGNVEFGGDVVGTIVEAGYDQNLATATPVPHEPADPSLRRRAARCG